MRKAPSRQNQVRCLGATALVMALAGCPGSPTIEPKVLAFNYLMISVSDRAAFIEEVRNGQRTISDALGADPCNFTADAAASRPLSIDILGTPGEEGFNVTISSATLVAIPTTNPLGCQAVTEIGMTIGALDEALDVGGTTNQTAVAVYVGGKGFSSVGGFFEGTLSSYNAQTGYATGEFEFLAISPATADDVLLVASGAYADD